MQGLAQQLLMQSKGKCMDVHSTYVGGLQAEGRASPHGRVGFRLRIAQPPELARALDGGIGPRSGRVSHSVRNRSAESLA